MIHFLHLKGIYNLSTIFCELNYFPFSFDTKLLIEEDYSFVQQPTQDYYCPVTSNLLLHPHQTKCCGKHLSEKATTRLQREKRACPLCNHCILDTSFDKHFQRKVKELSVFCCHKSKGCEWQGELAAFDDHLKTCQRISSVL